MNPPGRHLTAHLSWALRMMVMMHGKVCLLQELRVGDLVLPADVQRVSEASEMKVLLSVTLLILGT